MSKRSEGIKRTVLLVSVTCTTLWLSFVFMGSRGFTELGTPRAAGVAFVILSTAAILFTPHLIRIAVCWIVDRAKKRKEA